MNNLKEKDYYLSAIDATHIHGSRKTNLEKTEAGKELLKLFLDDYTINDFGNRNWTNIELHAYLKGFMAGYEKREVDFNDALELCNAVTQTYLRFSNKEDRFYCRHCKVSYKMGTSVNHEKGCIVIFAKRIIFNSNNKKV